MRIRYRFAVGVVAAVMSAGSFGATAHAATMKTGGGSSSSKSSSSPHQSWNGDRRNDFRQDRGRFRDHDRFNNHCCDNGNDNSGSDCDWLYTHDHDAWVRDCE